MGPAGPARQAEDGAVQPDPSSAYLKYTVSLQGVVLEESAGTPETETDEKNWKIIYTHAKCIYQEHLELESVQLRKHCNSKAARRRASLSGVLSAFLKSSGFSLQNVVLNIKVPLSNHSHAHNAIIRLHVLFSRPPLNALNK